MSIEPVHLAAGELVMAWSLPAGASIWLPPSQNFPVTGVPSGAKGSIAIGS